MGLYRSKKNRIIAGVCGGIAERFNVSPWLVRLLFLLPGGINLFMYIGLWIIMPEEN